MRYNALIDHLQNLINYKPSQAELSKILNVSRANISAKANRNSNIDDDDLLVLEKHYNISFSQQNVVSDNNIVITASCGGGVINANIDYLQLNKDCKYIYSFVCGDSMQPVLFAGDLAIIKVCDAIDVPNAIYCFTYGDEQYIKHLCYDINRLVISSDNKKYTDIVLTGDELNKIKVIGRVCGSVRKF